MDPNMPPNNVTRSSQTDSPTVSSPTESSSTVSSPAAFGPAGPSTTEVGSVSQKLPGLSGRRVAMVIGVFTLFSAITIPVGLFCYQRISDREKQIQKDWPEVAAQFNVVYAAIDAHLTGSDPEHSASSGDPASQTDRKTPADLARQWQSERRNFLFQRLWYQQVRAAQTLEGILQKPLPANEQPKIFFDKVSETLEPSEVERIRAAHKTAVAAYRRFETEQLVPYHESLTTFPGPVILFFFHLPEPPPFQPAELSTQR